MPVDHSHPHGELVKDDQRTGGDGEDPEQLVAVVGAEDGVGRDSGGIVVGEAGEQAGADDRQQRHDRTSREKRAPTASEVPVDMTTGCAMRASGTVSAPFLGQLPP